MSHVADTFNGLGYLPLQHRGYADQGFSIATMASILCLRITKLNREGDGVGRYEEDPDARGNLGGAICWPVPRSSPRKIAAWSFCFPASIVSGTKPTSSGSAVTVSGVSAGSSEDYAALPIRDQFDTPDTRFSTMFARRPGGHPKYPIGTLGLMVAATEENEQVERFLHCDPRLIAVNAAGEPGMGSLVCDLTPENKIDPTRTSPLQSAFRVMQFSAGPGTWENFLAFQLSTSGRGDTSGGLVYDSLAGNIAAQLSKVFSGIIDVGGISDQHQLDTDADGHAVNSAHLSEEAYFRSRDGVRDGPLRFDGNYVPAPRAPYLTQTFWTWDATDGHDFILGPRVGKYRWEGTSYKYEPSTPTPPPTTDEPPGPPPDKPKPPPDETTGGGPPGGGKPPDKGPPVNPPVVDGSGGGKPGGGWPEPIGHIPPAAPGFDPSGGFVPPPGWGPPPPGWGEPPKGGGKGPPGAGMPPGPGGVPLPGAAPGGTMRVGDGRRGGGFGGWRPPPPGRDLNAGAALGNRVRSIDLRPLGPRKPGVAPNPLDPNAGREKIGPKADSSGFRGGDLGLPGGIPELPPSHRSLAPLGRLPNTYSGVPAAGAPLIGARGPGEYRRVTAEPIETLHGPISFRAQDHRLGAIDFRNWFEPEAQAMRILDHTTPVVCRLEPYGAQGGTAGVGRLLGAAGAGDPWIKTLGPGVRYPGGTAAGGIVFLPPEITLTDLLLDADGVTKSAGHFTFAPGTYSAWGTPNLANGGIISGWRAGVDANANLVFDKIIAAGTSPLSIYPMGTVYSTATQVPMPAGTSEETLATYSLTASALGTSIPDSIIVRAHGTFAANGNTKTIKLKMGTGAQVVATNDITPAPNGGAWKIEAKLIVRSATTATVCAQATVGAVVQSVSSTLVNSALTSALAITVTGQDGTSSPADIVLDGFEVEKA